MPWLEAVNATSALLMIWPHSPPPNIHICVFPWKKKWNLHKKQTNTKSRVYVLALSGTILHPPPLLTQPLYWLSSLPLFTLSKQPIKVFISLLIYITNYIVHFCIMFSCECLFGVLSWGFVSLNSYKISGVNFCIWRFYCEMWVE